MIDFPTIQHRGSSITFTKDDFVASGGEGRVFSKNGIGFKIFHDSTRVIPRKKIQELAAIKSHKVIRPLDHFQDDKGQRVVGHTFVFLKNAIVLSEALSRSFWRQHGFDRDTSFQWIGDIHDTLKAIHDANILVVDLGETNMLLHDLKSVHFIDADSFQTPSFRATAIRDMVRDPLATSWTTDSDWYSFALLAFQILIGIHPFKGKHPDGGSVLDRMRNGHSLLDAGASMPPACEDLGVIPTDYMDWFRAMFSNQRRCPPPALVSTPAPILTSKVRVSQKCSFTPVLRTHGDPIRVILHAESPQRHVVLCSKHIWVDGRKFANSRPGASYAVKTLRDGRRMILTIQDGGDLKAVSLDGTMDIVSPPGNEFKMTMSCPGGRVVARTDNYLFEVTANIIRDRVHLSLDDKTPISRHATRFRDGTVVQDHLGTPCFLVLTGERGRSAFSVPELRDHKILMAKLSGKVIGVTSMDAQRRLYLSLIRLGEFGTYEISTRSLTFTADPNVACLPNGVTALLTEEGNLELSAPKSPTIKVVSDTGIEDMRIYAVGSSVWGVARDTIDVVTLKP